jgi:hypothetical protein
MENKERIVEVLKEGPGIGEIEVLEYKPEFLVLRFFYEYDDEELEAAKDYANNQVGTDDSEDVWYDEYYIPYIIDLAVDEVNDTIQEMVENMDLNVEFINYEPERDDERSEFIAVLTDSGREFDIDEVLKALDL